MALPIDRGGASSFPAPLAEFVKYESLKYLGDRIAAAVLLTVLSPVMVLIALLVKATSSGPVIYRQPRLTKGGQVFTMFKFRSMFVDAEAGTGPVWARCGDPRVTPLGRFLRVSRLDELPQLINVLRGEMSIIGPRPERPEIASELAKEIPQFSKRMAVRAGITGLAQVANGYASSVSSYRRKVKFDLHYVRHCSLGLDIAIALRTVKVIFTGFGAK